MQYRRLGRTGLEISLVSLGTGGPSMMGQQTGLDFEGQSRLIHAALELGINFFDTAAAYGESEVLLGNILAGVGRDRYVIASKSSPFAPGDERAVITPEELITHCDRSLTRLRTDAIDVYQLHAVHGDRYEEIVERLYPALEALRDAGKIRFIGITEPFFSDPAHTMLEQAVPSGLWDSVMLKYGILNQAAAQTVLPLCQAHDVGVLDMAAVRVKLSRPAELRELVADWASRGLLAHDALPKDDPLGWLVDADTDSPISAGYKFAAAHPTITTVITGTANLEHLRANTRAILGTPLPEPHTQRLRDVFGGFAEGA